MSGEGNVQINEQNNHRGYTYKTNKNIPHHVNVDIGNQQVGRVGANLSSRMPVGFVDESGNLVKGFFTQNEAVNGFEIFKNRFSLIYDNPKNEKYKPIYELMTQSAAKSGFKTTYFEWCRELGLSDKYIEDRDNSINILGDRNGSTVDSRNKFIEYLQKNGISGELLDAEKDTKSFWNYISHVLDTSRSGLRLQGVHTEIQRQGLNSSINKRNNAMYDYAELLGFKDLICKSSSMTVIKGGKKLEGTFMVNAKGTDHTKWDPRLKKMGNRKIEFSGSAIRDLSNLQVMDYLCANIDRHPGNMFYELDYSDPKKLTIKGIQGIDNDASFGQYEHKQRTKGFYSPLVDIKYMDSELVDKIMNLKPEDIDAKIRLAGLTSGEIQAAHDRLADLQQKIRDNKIKIVQGENAWASFADEMVGKSSTRRIRYADEQEGIYNIFDNAAITAEEYNINLELYAEGTGEFARRKVPSQFDNFAIGISKTSFEQNTVDVHKNELLDLHKKLTANYTDRNTKQKFELPDGVKDIAAKLKETTDLMQNISNSNAVEYRKLTEEGRKLYTFTIGDFERNAISIKFNELKKLAKTHLENSAVQPKTAFDKLINNYVKNMVAYVDYAKESIQNDAVEAEKNLASKMAEEINRQAKERDARLTLPALLKASNDVDSMFKTSSSQFKKMVSALKTLDQSKLKTIVDKQIVYNKIMDLAQDYIDHKLPEGKDESELSDYEKKRVDFAKDVIGFGEKCKSEAMKLEKERVANTNKEVNKNNVAIVH